MTAKHDQVQNEMDQEDAFFEAFERGEIPFRSVLTSERRAEVRAMAKATLNGEREKIALRVPRDDLVKLKSKAMREGIPYQTLINSLIHKYVND